MIDTAIVARLSRRIEELAAQVQSGTSRKPNQPTAGASLPATPREGRRWWHTLHMQWYRYIGTLWLGEHEYSVAWGFPRALQPVGAAGGTQILGQGMLDQRRLSYLTFLQLRTFCNSPLDASNYWTVQVIITNPGGNRTLYSAALASSEVFIGTVRTSEPNIATQSNDQTVFIQAVPTGTPGPLSVVADLKYRLIGA
jgi:hypothetical protein